MIRSNVEACEAMKQKKYLYKILLLEQKFCSNKKIALIKLFLQNFVFWLLRISNCVMFGLMGFEKINMK